MKKNRLSLIAITFILAMACNAQSLTKGAVAHRNDMENMPKQKMERATDARKVGPKRTVENSLYYTIPGSLFGSWTVDGSGYTYSMAMIPPFVDVTFANKMNDTSNCTWAINGTDITNYAKENGDYVFNYSPNGWYSTPILGNKRNNNSYQFNEDNYWVQTGGYATNDISLAVSYSPNLMMTVADVHGTRYYNGTPYRNVLSGYGFLNTSFLFGSGSLDLGNGDIIKAYGFEQSFNPLLAPMYLDEIHLKAVTYNNYGPIPRGKSIKAYIFALDGEGNATETIATFEATASDTIDFKDSDVYDNKTGYFGTVIYKNSNKYTDIFGNKVSLPAAIPAGVPFRIQFEGMNDTGVSLGAYAIFKSNVEDTYIKNGYLLFDSGASYTFQNPLCVDVELLGQYEVIDVKTKGFLNSENSSDFPTDKFKGWNVLHVSADGHAISTEGLEDYEDYDMGFAFVGTSSPWYDEDGNANYDFDESQTPDWVESIEVDASLYGSDNLTGYNMVYPICKPLPAGMTKRTCEIDIIGKAGIKGNNKIIIIQGDESSLPSENNKLYSDAVNLRTGEMGSISLNLDNDVPIIMAEFWMQLPDGVSIATDDEGYLDATLNASRTDRHSLEVEHSSNGLYHFLVYHSRNKALKGNSGELIHVNVVCDNNMEAGTYNGVIRNILLNDSEKNEIIPSDYSFVINVTDVTMGDVNGDGKINGSDIVELVDRIMERQSDKFVEAAADLNGDGKINGSDLTLEIELVMSQGISSAPVQPNPTSDGLSIRKNHDGTMSVSVEEGGRFILAQMVVELSSGQRLEGITTDRYHQVTYRQMSDNKYFVVCHSTSNKPFTSNDNIITIRQSGKGDATVSNAMLVDEARVERHFNSASSGDATGITATATGKPQAFDIYSLDGVLVRKQATSLEGLKKGVYLVNGNKLVVK